MLKENDVCILYVNGLPGNFVRIEEVEPDVKPGWFLVTFIELVLPLQKIKWKLDEGHIKGETIHMKGTEFNLQVLPSQAEKKEPKKVKEPGKSAKVISMADFKANRKVREIPMNVPPNAA